MCYLVYAHPLAPQLRTGAVQQLLGIQIRLERGELHATLGGGKCHLAAKEMTGLYVASEPHCFKGAPGCPRDHIDGTARSEKQAKPRVRKDEPACGAATDCSCSGVDAHVAGCMIK